MKHGKTGWSTRVVRRKVEGTSGRFLEHYRGKRFVGMSEVTTTHKLTPDERHLSSIGFRAGLLQAEIFGIQLRKEIKAAGGLRKWEKRADTILAAKKKP